MAFLSCHSQFYDIIGWYLLPDIVCTCMYMYKKNNEPNIIAIFVSVITFVTCNNDWTCTSYCYIRML